MGRAAFTAQVVNVDYWSRNTPPSISARGEVCLVGAAGTGAFSGNNNSIAYSLDGSTWGRFVPQSKLQGVAFFCKDSAATAEVNKYFGHNGTAMVGPFLTAAAAVAGSIQFTATDRILGRASALAGAGEEIVCTAAGRALLDDAAASNQRTTLGLGTLAVVSATLGSLATQSSVAHTGTMVKRFDGREWVSAGGAALALADATIDNATDWDGHTAGVLMPDGAVTAVGFSFGIPQELQGGSFAVSVGFRQQGAHGAGETVHIEVQAVAIGNPQVTSGGAGVSDSAVVDLDGVSAGSGKAVETEVPLGGGGWIDPGVFLMGVVRRDATGGNASDTFAGSIRLLWIKLSGSVSSS